jgi:signal transduction histidine kinase
MDNQSEKSVSSKKTTAYRVTVSILFGLLGFVVNLLTINLYFPPYTATILIGLLFPMLITLAWGWRYGLLSALTGGCQSMWWMWGPVNGYAIFSVAPPFTLWIVWHGFFAGHRKRRTGEEWWLNAYVVEIPFRILSTINLYTLARWAISLNPPPWGWASGASSTVPMHFSNFVVIKQMVVGYVIILLTDVLLNLGFVRRFLGLKERIDQTKPGYIISASLLLGVLFWVIDSVIGSAVFYAESSFLDLLALNIPPYVLNVRLFLILTCLIGGLVTSKLLRRQRESEVALRESEKKLSQILGGTSVPTFVIDKNHTVTHWNKACENLTGVSAGEMVGNRNHWTAFYSAKRPVMADPIMNELPEEEMVRRYNGKCQESAPMDGAYEAEHFFPDLGDSGKWLFFTAGPLRNYQGKVIGAIETFQDITERKTAEQALRESEKELRLTVANLKHSNVQLEQFAYIASHDLQEPLRMMSIYVQLLARRYKGRLDSDADDFIGYAVDGAKHMQTLINDLLAFSRVGTRGKPLEQTDCETVLEQAVTNLKMAIEDSHTLVTHNPLPTVMADASQLIQLIQNLIDNAIKFKGDEPPHIHVSAEQKEGEWVISVADDGIGIKPEFFDRIFVIFKRLHGRNTYPGTGIGLAVCKKIVERHKGRIWVESEPEKGTTFFFTIPITEIVK